MDMRRKGLDSLRKDLRSKSHSDELAPMEVTVGADSEKGLEEGLELAKGVVGKSPMKPAYMSSMDHGEDDLDDGMQMDVESEAEEIVAKLESSPELMKAIMAKLSL